MSKFKEEDVIAVSEAVSTGFMVYEPAGSGYSDFGGFECHFCGADKVENHKKIKHELDCPVLIANDLLTNHKGK